MIKNQHKNISLINGITSDYLNLNNRAIHFGDGVFETILCQNNNLFYWQKHYKRLKESAVKLQLNCPDELCLLDEIKKLFNLNHGHNLTCSLKIILSRNDTQRGYAISDFSKTDVILILTEMKGDYSSLLSLKLLSGNLCYCQQQVSINQNLAGIKHLNRLENVLARNECDETVIDGLMLNAKQNIIEGTMSNVFACRDEILYTPKLDDSGVAGIMRSVVIEIAQENHIKLIVKDIKKEEMKTMDEVFICNSLIGMKRIKKLNNIEIKKDIMTQNIFNQLLEKLKQHVVSITF